MRILGIETSCDETAAAVVEADTQRSGASGASSASGASGAECLGFRVPLVPGASGAAGAASAPGANENPWRLLSSVVASQIDIHREWGGVVPELASRQHVRDICGVVERALADAAVSWDGIDAIAVTQGPGLIGSLLVGVSFAKSAAWAAGKPLVAVNHLAGHIESLWLENGAIPVPAVVLVVSGGHTSLYLVPREGEYTLIGRTRDDAAGEAYDKVAKLLGLGYPGGPIIDARATLGNERAVKLPATRLTHPDRNAPRRESRFDFSFSGLKTAVLRHVRARQEALGADQLPEHEINDLSASFQATVVETLVRRTFAAAKWHNARAVGIAGGVSANSRLRAVARARGERAGIPVFVPSPHLSTDNAAMIAAAGIRAFAAARIAPADLNAAASLPLTPQP